MFDKAFIPFVQNNHLFNNNNNNNNNNKMNDPIDECMKYEFNRLKTVLFLKFKSILNYF